MTVGAILVGIGVGAISMATAIVLGNSLLYALLVYWIAGFCAIIGVFFARLVLCKIGVLGQPSPMIKTETY